MKPTRRALFGLSAGAAAALLARPADAEAGPGYEPWLRDFAGDAQPQQAGIAFDIPETVEDGAFVMVSVAVDAGRAETLTIVAPKNPVPVIATFTFSPMSGGGSVTTRIRLAESQTVLAAARLTDGAVIYDARAVAVAIGGCGE